MPSQTEQTETCCFYCNAALCADRRSLRRDTIASRDRFQPLGAHQNLALDYNRP